MPVGSWDVSSVTRMDEMFFGAAAFNAPLNAWDVSSVTSMSQMFSGASAFDQPLDDWDVSAMPRGRCPKDLCPITEWSVSDD